MNNSLSEIFQVQKYIDKKMEYQLIGCSLNDGENVIIPGYTRILRQQRNTNTGYLEYAPLSNIQIDMDKVKSTLKGFGYNGLFSMEFIRDKNDNDYFLKIVYNYAKIESHVPKEKIKEVMANSMIILNSIDYNENLIEKILEDEYYASVAEEYKIKKPDNTESKFSEYLSEYVVDEETVIPDLPEY